MMTNSSSSSPLVDYLLLHRTIMSSPPSSSITSNKIRHAYKTLTRLIQSMPQNKGGESSSSSSLEELRAAFRRPLSEHETIQDRLHQAGQRIAYLRIITPHAPTQGGRWIYKNGKRVEAPGDGRLRQKGTAGRVVSNWDGKNLDPESVKRHQQTLKRAGFVNNLHAKGIF